MNPSDFIAARHAMGLTQRQLAERLGVTTRAVQHWEGGTRPIPGPVTAALTAGSDLRAYTLTSHILPPGAMARCTLFHGGREWVIITKADRVCELAVDTIEIVDVEILRESIRRGLTP